MTKLEALTELAAKVDEGDHRVGMWYALSNSMHPHAPEYARRSFLGSLDAAKALHEAVLPEWEVEINFDLGGAEVKLGGQKHITEIGYADDPAHAWLLAIIRALIAQERAEALQDMADADRGIL